MQTKEEEEVNDWSKLYLRICKCKENKAISMSVKVEPENYSLPNGEFACILVYVAYQYLTYLGSSKKLIKELLTDVINRSEELENASQEVN